MYNISESKYVRDGEGAVIKNKNKSALSKWYLFNSVYPW